MARRPPTLLLLLLLALGGAAAQVYGSRCNFYNERGEVVPDEQAAEANRLNPSEPLRRLCIPNQCPSAELKRGNDHYLLHTDGIEVHWKPGFDGYFFEQICEDVITLNETTAIIRARGEKLARDYEKGCAPMYPLPDLDQATCQSLIPLWVILIFILFWALALVCEEFLQPAISYMCAKLEIPDNVAGATILAAGCNAPELFSSVIAIYISNSPVGVGTVVGSAPFNVCCITGVSAMAVGGVLALDGWIMAREVIGLVVPMTLFLWFLDDYLIKWWEALILVAYYGLVYVPVLCYFDDVKAHIIRMTRFLDPSQWRQSTLFNRRRPRIGICARSPCRRHDPHSGHGHIGLHPHQAHYQPEHNNHAPPGGGKRGVSGALLVRCISNTLLGGSIRLRFEVPSQQATLTWQRLTEESMQPPKEETGDVPVCPVELSPVELSAVSLRSPILAADQAAVSLRSPMILAADQAAVPLRSPILAPADLAVLSMRSPFLAALPPLIPPPMDLAEELMPVSTAMVENASLRLDDKTIDHLSEWDHLVADCLHRCEGYIPNLSQPFTGIMLKKSRFYSKVHVARLKWHPRYFIVDSHPTNPCRYSRVGTDGKIVNEKKFVTLPLQHVLSIERPSPVEVLMTTPHQTYKLRMVNADIAEAAATEMAQKWFDRLVVAIDAVRKTAATPLLLNGEEEEDEGHEVWNQPPHGFLAKLLFYTTFPLKWAIFMTTPNVLEKSQEHKFVRCIFISSAWLAILAFAMMESVQYLGCAIAIDPTAMGLSLGAIGTSFPNLYASVLIARAGDGVTAVTQAIASNTFNICIGLALFWFLKTIGLTSCNYGSDGRSHLGPCGGCYAPIGARPACPYLQGDNNLYGKGTGSTQGAMLVVFIWMAVFVFALLSCKGRINRLVAILMILMYVLYMLYEILNAYGVNFALCFLDTNICL